MFKGIYIIPASTHVCPNISASGRQVPANTWRALSAASRSFNRTSFYSTRQPTLADSPEAQAQPSDSAVPVSWDAIHVGRMPLIGLESIVELVPQSINEPLLHHTFVALASSTQQDQSLIVDFLPERPTDPGTALILGAGGAVPGHLRMRHLKGTIGDTKAVRTRFVARLQPPRTDAEVREGLQQVNRAWDPQLRLLRHDCRHYAAAVLSYLTGTQYGIEDV